MDITIESEVYTMAVDANGNLYYGGATDAELAPGNMPDTLLSDIWFAKRSGSTGNLSFIKQFSSQGDDSLKAMVVDNSGNIMLAGITRLLLSDSGDYDSFLMKFTQQRSPIIAPRITFVSPVTVNPGGTFTINGTTLGGTQSVFYNDKYLPFLINSSSQITVTAPDGLNGTGNITISSGCLITGFPLNGGIPQ